MPRSRVRVPLSPPNSMTWLAARAGTMVMRDSCVTAIVYPDGPKSLRTRSAELRRITLCRSTPRRLPTRVVDLRDGLSFTGKDKLGVLTAKLVDHGFGDSV